MLFSTAIAALLAVAGSAQASDESRRSSRRLSFDLIAGYEPGTKVTDHVSSPQIDVTKSKMLKSNKYALNSFEFAECD
jgi:hypothetical protein